MHFVLRLSPEIHRTLSETASGIYNSSQLSWRHVQAFSTLLHETIHWWQHIGSTAGFLQSLSYPIQTHMNYPYLQDFIKQHGAYKSILRFGTTRKPDGFIPAAGRDITNIIVNNFMDVEFYRVLITRPDLTEQVCENPYFESMGHTYRITYDNVLGVLDSMFDREFGFLPNPSDWHEGFKELEKKKTQGYYYRSPIYTTTFGLRELFEGQARFCQLQYLYFASNGRFSWEDAKSAGMLSEVYIAAFHEFLKFTESDWPNSIEDPLVGLFLIVCDIALNPGAGFPLPIIHLSCFVDDSNPAMRFITICRLIVLKMPHLKKAVQSYSKQEYIQISEEICEMAIIPSPMSIADKIDNWSKTQTSIIHLMEEDAKFQFIPGNQAVRILFARYTNYCRDKRLFPEIFCWPGAWFAGERVSSDVENLFMNHQAMFTDKADDDSIFPVNLPGKSSEALHQTFNDFYLNAMMFDVVKQWIINEGEFKYDFKWLSDKYSPSEYQEKIGGQFEQMFGVNPSAFIILS
jgi:hypothetical protein